MQNDVQMLDVVDPYNSLSMQIFKMLTFVASKPSANPVVLQFHH